MKTTDTFKETIKAYLDKRAEGDSLFAAVYENPRKSIDDCCTYILNEVKKSGCCGFADDEIYSMAVHYYDEEHIDPGKPVECRVVVNVKGARSGEREASREKRVAGSGERGARSGERVASREKRVNGSGKLVAGMTQGSLF